MKKASYLFIIFSLLLLVACQESTVAEVAEATAIIETDTAVPLTNTPSPAATTPPTETATETAEPTATATLEPTATHTSLPTDTPIPEPTATNTPTETATAVAEPATATIAPPPPAAPPPAPAPAGPNLLTNPGFEFGSTGWEQPNGGTTFSFHTIGSEPQFIHSGQQAYHGFSRIWQKVSGVTPGTTYRAGGWLKIWSSTQDDHNVSVNPADILGRICINTNGDDEISLPTTICSSWAAPYDVWQFISVDGVATNDRVTIILQAVLNNRNDAIHLDAIWDDITIGTAPAAATATPPPASGPVRPNPVPFNPTALRDTMNNVRSSIEQAGGLLDRLFNGEPGTCTEYQGYYDEAIRSATYSGVPDDWAGIYNDTIFAVENFLGTNESINALCDDGGGSISALNYGAARTGINDSLNRLIPAIEAANTKLGG